MSFFSSLGRIAKVAAPIALGFTGIGLPAATALGAGIGALGGGGIRGALLGGASGAIGAGGLNALGGYFSPAEGALTQGAQATGQAYDLSGITPGLLTQGGTGAAGNAINLGANAIGSGALNLGAGSFLPNSVMGSNGSVFGNILNKIGGVIPTSNLGNIATNLYSGIQGTQDYKNLTKAQLAANQSALNAVSPFMQSGQAANERLNALLGLYGNNSADVLNTLQNSPGYQFRLQQGQQALDRSLASRGGLLSGRELKATQELGQGLADQTYNDYVRSLANQSAQGLGAAGTVGGLYGAGGDILANRIAGTANLRNRSIANILGGY